MKLGDLINTTHWLSVELTLLELYPNVKEMIEEHRNVYEKLEQLEPEHCNMEIVLSECKDDFDDEPEVYIDVSGRKPKVVNSISYALEFTEWKKWLGMELAYETIANFSELEIITHCLYEMTFVDYEESEIQEQFDNIKNVADKYEKLTEDEKKIKPFHLKN